QIGDQTHTVAKDMDIDIRALADMAGHDAPDQAGTKGAEESHEPQGFQTHGAQMPGALFAFMHAGEDLDLIADFRVGRAVFGFDASPKQAFGGFAFGSVVFRFDAFVHQTSGFERDRLTHFAESHSFRAPLRSPSRRRGAERGSEAQPQASLTLKNHCN